MYDSAKESRITHKKTLNTYKLANIHKYICRGICSYKINFFIICVLVKCG